LGSSSPSRVTNPGPLATHHRPRAVATRREGFDHAVSGWRAPGRAVAPPQSQGLRLNRAGMASTQRDKMLGPWPGIIQDTMAPKSVQKSDVKRKICPSFPQ